MTDHPTTEARPRNAPEHIKAWDDATLLGEANLALNLLCNGSRRWTMTVPPDPRDQDLIFAELIDRFAARAALPAQEPLDVDALIRDVEALPAIASQHTCWDDHEGGPNGPHADGSPCRDRVRWEAVDRAAVLDLLAARLRDEEHPDD